MITAISSQMMTFVDFKVQPKKFVRILEEEDLNLKIFSVIISPQNYNSSIHYRKRDQKSPNYDS
jgi:hypothetical protein